MNELVAIPGREDKLNFAIGVLERGDGTPLMPMRFQTAAGSPSSAQPAQESSQ